MYALVLVGLYVVAWLDVLFLGSPPLNAAGTPIAGDYIAFHAAGRLVLQRHPELLYDHASLSAIQDSLLGGRIPGFYDAYRNPPFFVVIYTPLAMLDLLPGFALWSVLSLAFLAVALKVLLDEVPTLRERWRGLLIFVFAFAPVYFGLIDGENATLSLLLYALIYRSLARDQVAWAGVWSALGLFKPQLFFVFPLILLVTRRWRGVLAYVLVAAVLAAVSLLMVGVDGVQAWASVLLEPETGNATVNGWRMASAKSFFDALLPGQTLVSFAAYAVVGLGLTFVLLRSWARESIELPALWLLTCLTAVLIDPHLVDYDLTVLIAAGVIGASWVPRLLWAIVPLYVVTLLRAQLPLDGVSLQLTAPVLVGCAIYVVTGMLRPSPRIWTVKPLASHSA